MRNPRNSPTLPLEVITVNRETGANESVRSADFATPSARKWLQNHIFWACYQGKGIAINPLPLPPTESTTA